MRHQNITPCRCPSRVERTLLAVYHQVRSAICVPFVTRKKDGSGQGIASVKRRNPLAE
jgi:hypothetical protein